MTGTGSWTDGRRVRRAAAVVGFVLVLSAVPASLRGADGTARAQELGGFGGYQLSARGMGFSLALTLPAVLPVDTPAEATLALATATLSSGGTGFGQASSLFPGPLIANLRPLLGTGAGVDVPLPDYPIIVESREHEDAKSSRVPGVTMSSNVNPDEAIVTSDLGGITLPGILNIGNIRTVSTAAVDDGEVRSETRTEVAGVNVLAGVIQIDSIVTTATSTSDGESATCDGSVRIGGARVNGRSIVIDNEGVKVDGDNLLPPILDPNEIILTVLRELGLELRVLGVLKGCDGARADTTARGLFLSLPLPELGPLPPGGSVSLVIGSASTVADATPPFVFELPEPPDPPSDAAPPGRSEVPSIPTPAPPEAAAAPTPSTASPTPTAPAADLQPAGFDYDFGGVPVGMVLGLTLLAVPGAGALRRYLRRVMAMVGSE